MATMANHARRLEKLEAARSETADGLTFDELNVRLLLCAATVGVLDEISNDISETVAKQASPEYEGHREWLRRMWRKRTNQIDYEHCLTGGAMGEYRDWELPNIMERRRALRTSAIVQSLLKVN